MSKALKVKVFIFCFGCCLLVQASYAGPMFISPGASKVDVGTHTYFLRDEYGVLDVKELLTGNYSWQRNHSETVNLGNTRSVYWLRISLQNMNVGNDNWILEQRNALIDNIQLYVVRNGETLDYRKSGDMLLVAERPIHHSKLLFPLVLPTHSISDLYLRVETTGLMEVAFRLWKPEEFQIVDRQDVMIDGFFYGLFAVMALYNLVVFFSLRERAYVYYVFYVIASMYFVGVHNGHFFMWLYPSLPLLHHYSVPASIVFLTGSVLLFFEHFLDFRRVFPKIWLFINGLMALVVCSLMALSFASYDVIMGFILSLIVAIAVLSSIVVGDLAFKGKKVAQVFLTGWLILLSCGAIGFLAKRGMINSDFFVSYSLQAAFSFQIILFSLALAFRLNEAKQEKREAVALMEEAQTERIKAEDLTFQKERELRRAREGALEQQRELNENLEKTVRERTMELEEAMVHLNKVNAELEELSVKDGLTGVFNRRFFDKRAVEEWDRATRTPSMLSVLLLDLDHFKKVNDTRGHQCGDKVLQETAQAISEVACRPADIVARYGGEEFVVLLPGTSREGAIHVAGLLVRQVANLRIFYDDQRVPVTMSIGMATMMPTIADKLEDFISSADEALYQSKKNGRNRYTLARPI